MLYVIDGGDYNPFGIGDYDFIRPEHVNWLRETHQAYQTQFQHNFQHNLLFTHIPLQEYREVENINIMAFSMNLLRAQKLIPDYLVRCY